MSEGEADRRAAKETTAVMLKMVDRLSGIVEKLIASNQELTKVALGRIGDESRTEAVAQFDQKTDAMKADLAAAKEQESKKIEDADKAVEPEPAPEAPAPEAPAEAPTPEAKPVGPISKETMAKQFEALDAKRLLGLVTSLGRTRESLRANAAEADDEEMVQKQIEGQLALERQALAALDKKGSFDDLSPEQLQSLLEQVQDMRARTLKQVTPREAFDLGAGRPTAESEAGAAYRDLVAMEAKVANAIKKREEAPPAVSETVATAIKEDFPKGYMETVEPHAPDAPAQADYANRLADMDATQLAAEVQSIERDLQALEIAVASTEQQASDEDMKRLIGEAKWRLGLAARDLSEQRALEAAKAPAPAPAEAPPTTPPAAAEAIRQDFAAPEAESPALTLEAAKEAVTTVFNEKVLTGLSDQTQIDAMKKKWGTQLDRLRRAVEDAAAGRLESPKETVPDPNAVLVETFQQYSQRNQEMRAAASGKTEQQLSAMEMNDPDLKKLRERMSDARNQIALLVAKPEQAPAQKAA